MPGLLGFYHIRRHCLQAAAILLAVFFYTSVMAAIDPELESRLMQLAPHEVVSVIVTLKEMPRPERFATRERKKRDGKLAMALLEHARTSQARLLKYLKRKGLRKYRDLWHINSMMLKVRADQVAALAAQPGVVEVRYDSVVRLAEPVVVPATTAPEWNLNAVQLPALWAAGYTGTGVVVATMDSGVDILHPDLDGKWRGGTNSWFDPSGEHAAPYDASGHGTQVMGLLVGGSSSGVRIGAAPDALYIASKVFDDSGTSTYSAIHAAFSWLLDPDNNPATNDVPDVVNVSWGLPGSNNKCNVEFDNDIRVLRAAGISVIFAGGNDGPAPATGVSPASSVGFISTGSVNSNLEVSNFSSRGPSPCSGGNFPTLVAPGESVYTTDLTLSGKTTYATVSGTSFAAPHVAGIVALLAGAFPNLGVDDLETAVMNSTRSFGLSAPDNNYGSGMVNGDLAYKILLNRPAGRAPVISSVPATSAMIGVAYSYQVIASDADGDSLTYMLDTFPAGMTISESGLITWVPGSSQAGQQLVEVRVKDPTGLYITQPFVVVVANVNDAPVANDDNYTMYQPTSLVVPAPGVLLNDTDSNKNPLIVSSYNQASTGNVAVNEDGSFVYAAPTSTFTGIATFTYHASDGGLSSTAATVTINVQLGAAAGLTLPGSNVVNPVPLPGVILPESGGAGAEGGVADPQKPPIPPEKEAAADDARVPVITSEPVLDASRGELYTYRLAVNDENQNSLIYALDVAPEGMNISSTGEISWTPNTHHARTQSVVVRVTNAKKQFARQTFLVTIKGQNVAPVAEKDSYNMMQGAVLKVSAPGVLLNDAGGAGTAPSAVKYSVASAGLLQAKADGSFVYRPPSSSFAGEATFSYRASDGERESDPVTVSISVFANRPPRVLDDIVHAPWRKKGAAYQAMPVNVLENDMDPDTVLDMANKIDMASLTIISQPNMGGKVKAGTAGWLSYVPAAGFKGVEKFSYTVRDTRKAVSNTAEVQINVK